MKNVYIILSCILLFFHHVKCLMMNTGKKSCAGGMVEKSYFPQI